MNAVPDVEADCHCSGKELMIFSCSGGCNVGQLANDVARQLSKNGTGKMACIAAVAAGVAMAIGGAKEAKAVLVIDGCPVQCARKTLEKADLKPTVHVICTDIGLRKVDETDYSTEALEEIERMAVKELKAKTAIP